MISDNHDKIFSIITNSACYWQTIWKKQTMIRAVNISKIFRTETIQTSALKEVNFSVEQGRSEERRVDR